MRVHTMVAVVTLFVGPLVACSPNPSGPVDPNLTYEMVAKDVGKYKGKRVRWYGQFSSGQVKERGSGSHIEGVFVDTRTDFAKEVRAFSVEADSPKKSMEFMFDVHDGPKWVTGVISGSREEEMYINSDATPRKVLAPILHDATFESAETPIADPAALDPNPALAK